MSRLALRAKPLSLRELQRRFFSLITAPEGVDKGLGALDMTPADLEKIVRSDERRSAVERLDIYANMYFFRILDVLREMFPKLTALVGDTPFHNLVTDYLLAFPSSHPSLRNVGEKLPAFLDASVDPKRPWLADLARLEWARHDVFDGGDATALTLDALRALPPAEFAGLPLELIPSHARIATRYSVDGLWQSLSDGEEPIVPRASDGAMLIWRRHGEVLHRVLDEREAAALAEVAEGTSFGILCEWVAGRVPEAEAPQVAFGLLAQWATDGVLVARD